MLAACVLQVSFSAIVFVLSFAHPLPMTVGVLWAVSGVLSVVGIRNVLPGLIISCVVMNAIVFVILGVCMILTVLDLISMPEDLPVQIFSSVTITVLSIFMMSSAWILFVAYKCQEYIGRMRLYLDSVKDCTFPLKTFGPIIVRLNPSPKKRVVKPPRPPLPAIMIRPTAPPLPALPVTNHRPVDPVDTSSPVIAAQQKPFQTVNIPTIPVIPDAIAKTKLTIRLRYGEHWLIDKTAMKTNIDSSQKPIGIIRKPSAFRNTIALQRQ